MKKLVGIQAQATPYYGTVQMKAEDVRPELDNLWQTEVRKRYAGKRIEKKGFRPRAVTQQDVESSDITEAYREFWLTQFIDGIRDKVGRPLIYVNELNVNKQGNMFLVNAIVFFLPNVQFEPSKEAFLKSAAEIFLSDAPVQDIHVEEDIEKKRTQMRFHGSRIKVNEDHEDTLKEGDIVLCEITNEFAKAQNIPPEKHILAITDQCPPHYRSVIEGAHVGDTVLGAKTIDAAGEQKVTEIIAIKGLVDAPEPTDEELYTHHGMPSMEAFRLNVRREIEKNLTQKFDEAFSAFLTSQVRVAPVPGAVAYDRAEGMFNHMMQGVDPRQLKKAGLDNPAQAIHRLLPRINNEIQRECICYDLAKELGLTVTEEEILDAFKEFDMIDSPESRIVTEMDIYLKKVYNYYRTKGEDKGDKKLILNPNEAGPLPPPPTEEGTQARPDNLIHLK